LLCYLFFCYTIGMYIYLLNIDAVRILEEQSETKRIFISVYIPMLKWGLAVFA